MNCEVVEARDFEGDSGGLYLEAFLDPHDFCIRSFIDGNCPLFELEDRYESENAQLLQAIEDEELDDKVMTLFQGWLPGGLDNPVKCDITDTRDRRRSTRTVWLTRKGKYDTGSDDSGSSDPEPMIDGDDDVYVDGFIQ